MRVTFSSPTGGLRVIPEIPDLPLARIEGRNGIGKSLAARLLELVSGQPPYAALPLAWNSLVDQLGRVSIRLEGVNGHVFDIELDSATWRHDHQDDAIRNPGKLLIDGQEGDWAQARRLLQVRRIAGDETLGESIGLSLHETGKVVDAKRLRISSTVDQWSGSWDQLRMPESDPLAKARSLVDELEEVNARRARVDTSRRDVADSVDAVRSTAEQLRRLRSIDSARGELDAYRDAWQARADLSAAISKLESDLVTATIGEVLDNATAQSVNRLLRLVRIRRDALARVKFQEREVLRALELATRPTEELGETMLAEAVAEHEQAKRLLRTQHAAGTIRDTAAALERELSALPTELEAEAIAELDRDVSVGELTRGLQRRRASLRDTPKSETVLQLENEMARLSQRISLLQSLPAVLRAVDRKTSKLAEAESELESMVQSEQAGQDDPRHLSEELAENRERFAESTTQALIALVGLRTAAGLETVADTARSTAATEEADVSGSDPADEEQEMTQDSLESQLVEPEVLEADLHEIAEACVRAVEELGIVTLTGDWGNSIDVALASCDLRERDGEAELASLAQEAADIAADGEVLLRELSDLRASEFAFAEALWSDPEWSPLRETALTWLARQGVDATQVQSSVEGLRAAPDSPSIGREEEAILGFATQVSRAVQALEEVSSAVRDSWGIATAFVRREAHDLAPRLVQGGMSEWQLAQLDESAEGRVLRAWLETEVGHLLSQAVLRKELFEDAPDVEYDLRSRAVVWRSSDGRRRRRPLEAFSSGEQVFAYTRAKLETLRTLRSDAEHLTVFLDEFGAFVARERFGELMRYVQTDVLGEIADQVIVMLPSGDNAAEFDARASLAEYATDDYLVESIAGPVEVR